MQNKQFFHKATTDHAAGIVVLTIVRLLTSRLGVIDCWLRYDRGGSGRYGGSAACLRAAALGTNDVWTNFDNL